MCFGDVPVGSWDSGNESRAMELSDLLGNGLVKPGNRGWCSWLGARGGGGQRRSVVNYPTIAQNTCGNVSWVKGHTKAGFALHRHYWLFIVIRERQQQQICAAEV